MFGIKLREQISFVKFTILTTFVVTLLLTGQFAEAQFAGLTLHSEVAPELAFDESGGTTSYTRTGVAFSLLILNVAYTMNYYSWTDADKLPFGNGTAPWETLHSLSAGGMFGDEINARWSYLSILQASAAFEEDIEDAYWGGVAGAGVAYTLRDNLDLIIGGGALYDDFEEVQPLPMGGVQWNTEAASGFSLSLIFPLEAELSYRSADSAFAASVDPLALSANISYQMSPVLGVGVNFSGDNESIHRLAKDSSLIPAGDDKRYLKTEDTTVDMMFTYTPFQNVVISAGPYYAFDRELSIRDVNDDSVHSLDGDETIGGKFLVSIIF